MIPQISSGLTQRIETVRQPGRTFRVTDEFIGGSIDGLGAIEQAVFHILNIERYAYPIFGDDYGIEFAQYRGKTAAYIKATIQGTLKSALMQDDRIKDVKVKSVTQPEPDAVAVVFEVHTVSGTFDQDAVIRTAV
jgi:hypothetical protein